MRCGVWTITVLLIHPMIMQKREENDCSLRNIVIMGSVNGSVGNNTRSTGV